MNRMAASAMGGFTGEFKIDTSVFETSRWFIEMWVLVPLPLWGDLETASMNTREQTLLRGSGDDDDDPPYCGEDRRSKKFDSSQF